MERVAFCFPRESFPANSRPTLFHELALLYIILHLVCFFTTIYYCLVVVFYRRLPYALYPKQ